MRWTAEGWIVGIRDLAVNSYMVYVLAEHKGVWSGIARGKRPILGSRVSITWNAKDITTIGSLKLSLIEMPVRHDLNFICACEAIIFWCNEREALAYGIFEAFLGNTITLKQMLQQVLKVFWNVDVQEKDIASIARRLELRKLLYL